MEKDLLLEIVIFITTDHLVWFRKHVLINLSHCIYVRYCCTFADYRFIFLVNLLLFGGGGNSVAKFYRSKYFDLKDKNRSSDLAVFNKKFWYNLKMNYWFLICKKLIWFFVAYIKKIYGSSKPEYPEKTNQPVASHWQTLSHNVVSSTPRPEIFNWLYRTRIWLLIVYVEKCQ